MDAVQEQVDAFNARDVERFIACYRPDAVIEDGAGNRMMQGHEEMRAMYGPLFSQSPNLHVEIPSRIRVGSFVIDEEQTTGINMEGFPGEMHSAVVYRLDGDKIAHVHLLM